MVEAEEEAADAREAAERMPCGEMELLWGPYGPTPIPAPCHTNNSNKALL